VLKTTGKEGPVCDREKTWSKEVEFHPAETQRKVSASERKKKTDRRTLRVSPRVGRKEGGAGKAF